MKMDRTVASMIVQNALESHVQDGISGPDFKEEREQLDEAWNTMQEPMLDKDEVKDMKVILESLDPDSRLHTTLLKVMRGIGFTL